MLVSLSQYRGTIGMFNIFANKRCIICYRRKMQLCKFVLIIILFILLQAFSLLIGFFFEKCLIEYANGSNEQKISYKLFSSCSYLYHIWLFPRLVHLSGDIEKNPGPKKDISQTFSIGH